ncbi:BID domain-containing T4SS effector [Bartonella senegalensis]|uniref:BID domain-containing T4SS effector n=1 Tax=Bartonella senegalensis TaxID=1468418 RepID=UPI0002DF3857|nr:BID domain-containing T4SS effector [Bartonella senegalensis]
MKKNQPAPSAPPSVKELRSRYEKLITGASSSESPSTRERQKPPRMRDRLAEKEQAKQTLHTPTAPPQKPPRMRDRLAKQEQAEQTLHAPTAPPKPPRLRDRLAKQEQAEQTLHTPTAPPQKPPRLKKQFATMMQQNLLVEAYQKEIQHWCGIVYGHPAILQEKIEEIQKNPNMGEQIAREVTEKPTSIHPLAGHKMLSVKTGARKNAEDGLSSLCAAIQGYTCAVQQAQESIEHFPHSHRPQQEGAQRTDTLQRLHHTQQEKASLSNEEITRRVQKNPSVQYGEAEIRHWCQIVFGKAHVLQYRVEDVQKIPAIGEELSWQVANTPHSFHKLAGNQVLGIKNSARKEAEAGLSFLCNAIEAYADTVKKVREEIVQTHQAQQNRQELPSRRQPHDMQNRQTLSQPAHQLKAATGTVHKKGMEDSRQEQPQRPNIRPGKVETTKTMAFAS